MSDTPRNIGFGGLLTLLFIGLKLGHVIDWSWWWVLAPMWIPLAVAGFVFLSAFFFIFAGDVFRTFRR